MPLHFEDLDVISEAKGSSSALIVPCNMCPAATVAAREKKPFLRIFNNFLKSAPFDKYIATLQDRLQEQGVRDTKVFKSNLPHQWFLCMWTAARQKKLRRDSKKYETIIVLGCESATETVRDSVKSTNCKVIEGMKVTGIMNTKLSLRLPCDICFKDSRVIPLSPQNRGVHSPNRRTSQGDSSSKEPNSRMLKILGQTVL
jgi:hypothetical protein